ncbi:MAG: ABC transporter permease, partial [Intestinimonas massiliensis]|uniref:ABC transporter permease n=1 Tax=Intestinimonas massiliensis (ex Afouda et al. 2020) TaxID=1673721 RepID=UPI00242CFE9A
LYAYCQQMVEYIIGVTPNDQVYGVVTIKFGSKTITRQNTDWDSQPQLYLGNQQYALCQGYKLAKGRDLAYLDIENMNQVCVLGARAAKAIFDYADPVGQTITINGNLFTVIGVYAPTSEEDITGKDRVVLLPYTLSRLFNDYVDSGNYVAVAKDAGSTTMAVTLLNGYLKGLVGDNGSYYAQSRNAYIDSSNEQSRMQQLFLGGIAAISLLVGGIGIMNIMLVTVTERTREIGIRKAIGAERRSIITQFLIEAAMICGIGGVFGIIVGYLGTMIVGKLSFETILIPSAGITVGAFFISVALGILFGMYPAIKASALQPVEALRAE